MGSSKKQTVGYWYHPIMHFGLCQGPIDAFLQFRGGDRAAWNGEITRSGEIYVNAPNLWGGEEKEGGIQGYCDVMFGEQTQQPNAYLAEKLGERSAFRGKASFLFKGGRYGAMNPYPKPASFKLCRILKGWDDDQAWYPETAVIGSINNTLCLYLALDLSGSMDEVLPSGNGQSRLANAKTAIVDTLESLKSRFTTGSGNRLDVMVVGWGTEPAQRISILRRNCTASDIVAVQVWVRTLTTRFYTYFPAGLIDAYDFFMGVEGAKRIGFFITDGAPTTSTASDPDNAMQVALAARSLVRSLPLDVILRAVNIDNDDKQYTDIVDNSESGAISIYGGNSEALQAIILGNVTGTVAMNAAHIIYDSLVSQYMQVEPTALINEESFRAAADKLYAEQFGLCTRYDPDAETVENFRLRICSVIGASCSRSRVNGQWYLDLIRGDYQLDDLPILTDDDILEYQEEPSTIDDAVNQVVVTWFDREAKEDRSTAPVHSLGAIRATGTVVSETVEYREIPVETLALLAAGRDLRNKATPLKRFKLTCNRTPYAWRIGTYFRLQTPKRGIADMVCMVGDINTGTLRSGAIPLVAIQDVFRMPATSYIVGQPPGGTISRPEPSPNQRLIEAPYVELAQVLSNADLGAFPADAGYVIAMGDRPQGGMNYQLLTAAAGEQLTVSGSGDWCPTAKAGIDAGPLDTDIALDSLSGLSSVNVGTAVLWDNEICRIDAVDATAGTVSLGRGCADTVPEKHSAGSTLYFYDEWGATDAREYAAGETVSAQLLTRTSSALLNPLDTPTLTVEMDERAARPYPPGQFRINGQQYPESADGPTPIEVTWVGRDRLLQADQLVDTSIGSIGPEAGTTYTLRGYEDGVLTHTESGIAATPAAWKPSASATIRIELEAERDGLSSWQFHQHTMTWTAGLPDDQIAISILGKLENWWKLNETAGPYLVDSHGGMDLQLFSGSDTSFNRPTVRPGGPTCIGITGTGGAFVWGNPEWWVKGVNQSAVAWVKFNAAANTVNRTLMCDAPASDASEAINQRLQWWAMASNAAPPNVQGTFWEYGVGVNYTGPSSETPMIATARMLSVTRSGVTTAVTYTVNGVADGGGVYTQGPTGGDSTDSKWSIGNVPSTSTSGAGTTTPADADMQDFALFRTPLSTDEITWLYNGGQGRSYEDLWSISEQTRLWTPTELRNKVVWSIADDPDHTIVSNVTQRVANRTGFAAATPINATSGYVNNLSTLNGRSVFSSDNASNFGLIGYPNTRQRFKGVNGITMVAVTRNRVAASTAGVGVLLVVPRDGSNGHLASMTRSRAVSGEIDVGGRRLASDSFTSYGDGINHGTDWIIAGGFNDYTAGNAGIRLNGNATATSMIFSTGVTSTSTKVQDVGVGGQTWSVADRAVNHELAEWLILDGLLTADEWAKLEGYLAHRWDLTANLPTDHPYKANPPIA